MKRARREAAVLDVETTHLQHGRAPRTKFWGLAYGNTYREFPSTAALWRFLAEPSTPALDLWHHHDFDAVQAICDGFTPEIELCRGGRILLSSSHVGKHAWRNSYALFPSSLAKILATIGSKKLPLRCAAHLPDADHDDPRLSPAFYADVDACLECDAALRERNRGDCVDGLRAFRALSARFAAAFGVDPLTCGAATAAGLAARVARARCGPMPVIMEPRAAYRGGRVEAFRVRRVPYAVESWDISSSYPASFLNVPERGALRLVEVDVRCDGPAPLFRATDDGGKLLFPRGKFRTYVYDHAWERYYAGDPAIHSARSVARADIDFAWLRNVGRAVVLDGYRVKSEAKARGDAATEYCAKIVLNSLFGRLAMRPEREVASITTEPIDGESVTSYRLPDRRWLNFRETIADEPVANVAFAAFVTDDARGRLYEGLRAAVDPVYCDTDSIFARAFDPSATTAPAEGLGSWERKGAGEMYIHGAKDYIFDGDVKRKGGDHSLVWTVRQALSSGVVRVDKKERRSSYDKRRVLPSGETRPLSARDW